MEGLLIKFAEDKLMILEDMNNYSFIIQYDKLEELYFLRVKFKGKSLKT